MSSRPETAQPARFAAAGCRAFCRWRAMGAHCLCPPILSGEIPCTATVVKDAVRTRAELVEVPVLSPALSTACPEPRRRIEGAVEGLEPRKTGEEVYTTGELGTGIIEQSLAVRTDEGLVVVTGCAHFIAGWP